MKRKLFYLPLAVLFLAFSSIAQPTAVFKVFANKGPVELKSGDTKQPLKTGSSLKNEDVLVLGDNCYVALVHSATGKPQELKAPGTYAVKDLVKGITGGSGVVTKYTEFILSSNSDEAKRNRLSATGAVHRGLNDIDVFLPEPRSHGNHVLGNSIVVAWEPKPGKTGPYEVLVTNMFDEEVAKPIETSSTKVTLQLPANEQMVNVIVRRKGEKQGSSHSVKQFNSNQAEDRVKMGQLKSELSDLNLNEETALNKYILAGFYEQQNLLINAIGAYEDAIRLAPDVDTYKEAYQEFLLRKQLKDTPPKP